MAALRTRRSRLELRHRFFGGLRRKRLAWEEWKRGILNRAAYGSRDRVAQKTLTDFALIYDVPQPLFKSQSHLPFAMISRAGNAPLRGEFFLFRWLSLLCFP